MSDENLQSPVEATENTIPTNEPVKAEGILQADNPEPTSFIDSLPEDIRDEASLKDFKDLTSLAKSYVHAQKLIGKSVRLPSEDSSPEARQEFLNKLKDIPELVNVSDKEGLLTKLGRPESADKYEISVDLGEEDSKLVQDFINNEDWTPHKEKFFELGLTQEQVNGVLDHHITTQLDTHKDFLAKIDSSQAAMKERWGNDYDNRLQASKLVLDKYKEIFPDAVNDLTAGTTGTNPIVLDVLSEYGKLLSEKGAIQGISKISYGMTPADAIDKINEKRSDKGFMKAYTDAMDPGHKHAVAELQKLYAISVGQ